MNGKDLTTIALVSGLCASVQVANKARHSQVHQSARQGPLLLLGSFAGGGPSNSLALTVRNE